MNSPVDATWTDPPELEGGEEFNTAWMELVDEHELFHKLSRVDLFAGLGQFAVLLIGLEGGGSLSTPIRTGQKRKVTFLQPYLEGSVSIKSFEENSSSPRFGKPLLYEIDPGGFDMSQSNIMLPAKLSIGRKISVHYSHLIHIADNTLENATFGHSRLEPVYNLLDDIMKVVGGSAETYWMAGNRGLQIDVDKEMDLKAGDADDLADEIEEYQHGLRRAIRTRGVNISNIGSDVADPKATFDTQLSMIAAATGIPKRVLIGVEAGQLASQQDRANWAVLVEERIAKFAQPVILKPAVKVFQNAGVLPEVKKIEYKWPGRYKLSPLERAQTSAQMARSMTNAMKALVQARNDLDVEVFSIEEARNIVGFGKHMPEFEGLNEGGTFPPKKEDEPEPIAAAPFGNPPAAKPKAKAKLPAGGK